MTPSRNIESEWVLKPHPGRDPAQKPLKIWAVWAVFQQNSSGLGGLGGLGGFFGKTAQTAQILLKKPLKNRSFLAVIFERFLSGFWAVFPSRGPRLNVSLLCKTRTNTFIQGQPICSNFPKRPQNSIFDQLFTSTTPPPSPPQLTPPPLNVPPSPRRKPPHV